MWIIARPKPKIQISVDFFRQHGISVCGVAPLDIAPCNEEIKRLASLIRQPNTDYKFIVTSTEAASRLFSVLPATHYAQCYCIGASTAALLQDSSLDCIVPDIATSEGLVELDGLQQVTDSEFVLVKGVGGRNHISRTLENRGATIHSFDLYERVKLVPAWCTEPLYWSSVEGVMVTSQSLAVGLIGEFGIKCLRDKIWVCASERIAAFARSRGIKEIHTSHGATDVHLLGWMNKYGRGPT